MYPRAMDRCLASSASCLLAQFRFWPALLTLLVCAHAVQAQDEKLSSTAKRPNILWFVVDDMSANFSCYGEQTIKTPNVDRLAAEGTRFSHAFITAPVCSPCRSALITGMYQTSIGSHQHRSGRGTLKIHLPDGVTPIPVLFQKAGYYTCIGSGLPDVQRNGKPTNNEKKANKKEALGKTDYNFEYEASMYDSHDWSNRKPGQPFFMQVQLAGGKLRADSMETFEKLQERARSHFGAAIKPEDVQLPPYYPRDPVLLKDWAAYLDAVRFTDLHVGQVIDRLKSEGLLESTWVLFMTDHGISHARGKQFLYNEGTHVPFVVRGPGVQAGKVRDDLIEHIDAAAMSLAVAGIPIPPMMQGKNSLAPDYKPRDAVFAARDRCDETVERIRSVRTEQYLYIRNFYPARPHLQPNAYKDNKAIVKALRAGHEAGTLSELTEKLLFQSTRMPEELYDWKADPWQVNNLASDPKFAATLQQLRSRLDRWIEETKDRGPESDEMYDSDMKVYLGKGNPQVEKNIAQMKKWAAEGK